MNRLPSRTALIIFSAFFFCSGAAGLIYEVLWMRQFGLVMGNTTISLSAVLTSFMGGLAIGSWIGGRIADRRTDHLRLYGILEVLIGLYALGVPLFIAATRPILAPIYQADPNSFALTSVRFALALLIMIVPTIFMGATLPVLIKHFTAREDEVGRRVGLIYGINTFGAMFGAFLAGFILIPRLGMNLTNQTAVVLNLSIGVLSTILGSSQQRMAARSLQLSHGKKKRAPALKKFSPVSEREASAALVGICLSGVAAMIYQVCWTRLFALLIGSSIYSFSMVVMANILGLAIGGIVFGHLVDRTRRPLLVFAWMQIIVALACYAIVYFSEYYPVYIIRLLQQHRENYESVLAREFAFIFFLVFSPTFLMGGMFPIVTRICATNVSQLGKTVGAVYTSNTIGAVIGSLTAGLVFLNPFGLWQTVLVAISLNLVASVVAVLGQSNLSSTFRYALLLSILLIGGTAHIMPSQYKQQMISIGPFYVDRFEESDVTVESLYRRADETDLVYYHDGLAGTVTVNKVSEGIPYIALSINGKTDASSNLEDMPTQLLLGHLGLLAYPEAQSAMLVGLGGGFTLGALTRNENLKSIDLVEISESVLEAVRKYFHELTSRALDDPRVNVIIGDGRNHLTLTDKKYDIIVNEPSNPWIAGISNLFTVEFFEAALNHLSEQGVMVQWIHTYNIRYDDFMQVIKTFMSVMPYAILWETNDGDYLILGAKRPIQFDLAQMHDILNRPSIKKQVSPVSLDDPMVLMSGFMATKEQLESHEDFRKATLNVDDTCRLEFSAPRGFYDQSGYASAEQLNGLRFSPLAVIAPKSLTAETKERLENIRVARRMAAEAANQFDLNNPADSISIIEKAVLLSPKDPLLSRRASEVYAQVLLDAFHKGQWAHSRELALRSLQLFDDLDVAVNHWDQTRFYLLLYHISKQLKDPGGMGVAYAGLIRIGGEGHARRILGLTEGLPPNQ